MGWMTRQWQKWGRSSPSHQATLLSKAVGFGPSSLDDLTLLGAQRDLLNILSQNNISFKPTHPDNSCHPFTITVKRIRSPLATEKGGISGAGPKEEDADTRPDEGNTRRQGAMVWMGTDGESSHDGNPATGESDEVNETTARDGYVEMPRTDPNTSWLELGEDDEGAGSATGNSMEADTWLTDASESEDESAEQNEQPKRLGRDEDDELTGAVLGIPYQYEGEWPLSAFTMAINEIPRALQRHQESKQTQQCHTKSSWDADKHNRPIVDCSVIWGGCPPDCKLMSHRVFGTPRLKRFSTDHRDSVMLSRGNPQEELKGWCQVLMRSIAKRTEDGGELDEMLRTLSTMSKTQSDQTINLSKFIDATRQGR